MSIQQAIQRQITEIEDRIAKDQGDAKELKKILATLRQQENIDNVKEWVDQGPQFLRD